LLESGRAELLPIIDEMLQEGLVTLEKVHVSRVFRIATARATSEDLVVLRELSANRKFTVDPMLLLKLPVFARMFRPERL
jgi:hypothetical protein